MLFCRKTHFICFDKGYVDYEQYEVFTGKKIWYVTRLKGNALYESKQEFDIPDEAHPGQRLLSLKYI